MPIDPLAAAYAAVEDHLDELKGADGTDGKAGLDGMPGPTGPIGPQGVHGTAGTDGKPGVRGLKGDKGDRGLQGIKGDKGDTGPEGPAGKDGDAQFHAFPRGGGGVVVQEDGTNVGPMSTLNFTGAGVTVTPTAGGHSDVDIPGGGGGLPPGGTPGQVVTNTAPGVGDWEDATGGIPDPVPIPETAFDGAFGMAMAPVGPHWTGAIAVRIPDINAITGNGYILRVIDQATGLQTFDLDAWGTMSLNAVAGNTAAITLQAGVVETFSVKSDGNVRVKDSSGNALFGTNPAAGIGFFGSGGFQQTAASLSDLWTALQAYGLLDSGSVAPAAGGSGSFLSSAKWGVR